MKRLLLFILLFFSVLTMEAQNISYDKLGRVTSIIYNDTTTVTYTYDAVGNRTSKVVTNMLNRDVIFALSDICQGDEELLLPIVVHDDLNNLGAISLMFEYDTTLLDFHSFVSGHPALNIIPNTNFVINVINNKIILAWPSTTPVFIQGGDTLFVLKFTPDGGFFNTATTTHFEWDSIPGNNEFSDNAANIMPISFIDTTLTILSGPTATLTNTANNDTICTGDLMTFTASGGVMYEFFVNNSLQGIADTVSSFSTSLLTDQDILSVQVTNLEGCSTIESDTITVLPLPNIGLIASDTSICVGTSVTFTTSGADSYEFFVNGISQGVASSVATFAATSLNDGDTIRVAGTNLSGCTDTSTNIIMVIDTLPMVTMIMGDDDGDICMNEPVTFTATGADEYIFYVNSVEAQAQSPNNTFTYTGTTSGLVVIEVIGVNASGCQRLSDDGYSISIIGCYGIEGEIVYRNVAETPMGNVILSLVDTLTSNTKLDTTDLVNASFGFSGLSTTQTLRLNYSTGKTYGGINATDALLILLNAIGLTNFDNIQTKAADVDSTNTINAADALFVMNRFVQVVSSFPIEDWVFEDRLYDITGTSISNDKIYALAAGDVNGSYTPNIAETFSPTVFLVENGTIEVSDGEQIQLPVTMGQTADVGAVSLSVYFPAQLMTINSIQLSNGQNVLFSIQGGELRIAWADITALGLNKDDVLFYINTTIHDAASMANDSLSANPVSEIANGQATPYSSITLELPSIIPLSTNTNELAVAPVNIRNFPNPFTKSTTIEYTLPTTGEVTLVVHDELGREIVTLVNQTQTAGTRQVSVNAKDWASGTYFYTFTVKDGDEIYTITKQMILVK